MKYYTFEDNTILQSIINKTIVSLKTNCSIVYSYAFYQCFQLEQIDLPWCKQLNGNCFTYCSALSTLTLPNCTSINGTGVFLRCITLETLNLLSPTICTLEKSNTFAETPIADSSYLGYYGSIYVPGNLVESYKAAENWSYYSDRIAAYTP